MGFQRHSIGDHLAQRGPFRHGCAPPPCNEVLRIGIRGKAPLTWFDDVPSVIDAPREPHSRKPAIFHEIIERVLAGPYLEIFGRRRRTGWTVMAIRCPMICRSTIAAASILSLPPDLLERLKREYDIDDFDPFPYPCAEGHDAFAMERWPCEPGKSILINGSFVAADKLHGRGLTAVVRKVIEQHARYGTKFLVFMPTTDAVNRLMDAGAAMRSLGRVRWLEVDTLEPWPNPEASMLFILDSTDSQNSGYGNAVNRRRRARARRGSPTSRDGQGHGKAFGRCGRRSPDEPWDRKSGTVREVKVADYPGRRRGGPPLILLRMSAMMLVGARSVCRSSNHDGWHSNWDTALPPWTATLSTRRKPAHALASPISTKRPAAD